MRLTVLLLLRAVCLALLLPFAGAAHAEARDAGPDPHCAGHADCAKAQEALLDQTLLDVCCDAGQLAGHGPAQCALHGCGAFLLEAVAAPDHFAARAAEFPRAGPGMAPRRRAAAPHRPPAR